MFPKNIFFLVATIMLLVSCEAEENYTGTEYAPQMYHSVPYEPLTQFTEENVNGLLETWYYNSVDKSSNTISLAYSNKKFITNSLEPVQGTVKRQKYSSVEELDSAGNRQLLLYNIDADDFETAGKVLKNPVPKTDEILEEGAALYGSFCSHCHGEGGAGDGKVGVVYKGVANL
ncbi:MAG: mono/diheme cytochrome c family protein, partial [Flammeovirgaceae bacterium]